MASATTSNKRRRDLNPYARSQIDQEGGESRSKKHKPKARLIYTNFDRISPKWKGSPFAAYFEKLATDGYVVIPNVVKADVIKRCNANLDDILGCYPAGKPIPGIHGLQQAGPWGHIDASWLIRLAATTVYAQFWGHDDKILMTSTDAVNVAAPVKTAKKDWFHFDQSAYRTGVWQVQGQVPLTPQSKSRGCLVVLKQSHLHFGDFMDQRLRTDPISVTQDWVKLKPTETKDLEATCPRVYVESQPGDLVLWLSNTAHQGHEPLEAETKERRRTIYVCQKGYLNGPNHKKLKSSLRKRRLALLLRRTTSHAADEPKFFPAQVSLRSYGDAKKKAENDQVKADLVQFQQALEKKGLASPPIVIPKKGSTAEVIRAWEATSLVLREAIKKVEEGQDLDELAVSLLPINLQKWSREDQLRIWNLAGFFKKWA